MGKESGSKGSNQRYFRPYFRGGLGGGTGDGAGGLGSGTGPGGVGGGMGRGAQGPERCAASGSAKVCFGRRIPEGTPDLLKT